MAIAFAVAIVFFRQGLNVGAFFLTVFLGKRTMTRYLES